MEELKLTEEEIDQLIHCHKEITVSPKKEMFLGNGHWRNDMKVQSLDGEHDFLVFIRKNEDFEENFSIGLAYYPRDIRGEIHLLRCNGPHGPHESFEHHDRFHIHRANPDNLASGAKAERTAYITKEYASFQDALGYFLKKCNIGDAEKYFPDALQRELFPHEGGEK